MQNQRNLVIACSHTREIKSWSWSIQGCRYDRYLQKTHSPFYSLSQESDNFAKNFLQYLQHYRWFTKICSSSVMTYKSLLYIITDLLQFFFTSSKIWFFMTYGTSSNGKHWQWKLHVPTVQTCTIKLSGIKPRRIQNGTCLDLKFTLCTLWVYGIYVHVHCANRFIRLILLSDHTNQA